MAKILIAEDEKPINELIRRNLILVGHECTQAFDGEEALYLCQTKTFDLALLDIMMPVIDGFQLKRELPKELPVIFVTAKAGLSDRLAGLGLGADDYIVKPFEILELLARVEAVLRRTHAENVGLDIGPCHIELDTRRVWVNGEEIVLKPQEFALLEVLVRNRNFALSREKLLELAWNFDYEGDTRTVDVHIQRLRKKLGLAQQIETVYKLGYRLNTKK
ncbi:response regulator transcription factor [uncultured Ruthenibacterium sp.]|uniref:response regulator transcription factor n=1 Tax=uncultured Ruthenibacterium sp. TaxID=1905347 RepID=UPI00349EE764